MAYPSTLILPAVRIGVTPAAPTIVSGDRLTIPPARIGVTAAFGGFVRLAIRGETRQACSDCKCVTRCVCVERWDNGGGYYQGAACWDDAEHGWVGTVSNQHDPYDEESVVIHLRCNQCTGETEMVMEGATGGMTQGCPDVVADFQISDEYGLLDKSIFVTYIGCGETCPETDVWVCFCEDPGPNILYASIGECEGEGGFTVSIPYRMVRFLDLSDLPPFTGFVSDGFYYVSEIFQLGMTTAWGGYQAARWRFIGRWDCDADELGNPVIVWTVCLLSLGPGKQWSGGGPWGGCLTHTTAECGGPAFATGFNLPCPLDDVETPNYWSVTITE